jgi:hypothetical protein
MNVTVRDAGIPRTQCCSGLGHGAGHGMWGQYDIHCDIGDDPQ